VRIFTLTLIIYKLLGHNQSMGFWQELRRRRVYRMAGLYIVGAWVVIQVADISFPAWGVPESALRYLFIAAAACFPVALIFSWYYDITPKGIVRTEPADGTETIDLQLKQTDYIVLAGLFAVGLVVLFSSVSRIQEEIGPEPAPSAASGIEVRENSIAVLPFTNLDINQDTGYFSDGITDDILNRLSSLKSLHVLASNSSFAFRDSEESMTEIMAKLRVHYLLQGSIRREDDYVRVTARLIDEGGFQIWSEQFDRKLEGIFAIQTEIASNVANQVIHEIIPLQELPAGRTTSNMEAYNQYLAGKAYLDSRTEDWIDKASTAFRQAMELDPGFAPPYAGLAKTITVNTGRGAQWEEGRQLAEKAIELDNEFAGSHEALCLILMAEGSLHEATLSCRRALELNPSLGFSYNILAILLDRTGQPEEATEVRNQGLAVDPLNPPLVVNIASMEGDFDRAEQLLLRLLSIPSPPPLAIEALYDLYDQWGRFADAVDVAKQVLRESAASGDMYMAHRLSWAYGNLGMRDDADYWMNLALEDGQPEVGNLDWTYNLLKTRNADSELGIKLQQLVDSAGFIPGEHHSWQLAQFGLVNIQRGNFEKGAEQLDLGLRYFQAGRSQKDPADNIDVAAIEGSADDVVWVMHLLAFTYQQLGQTDKADTILTALENEFELDSNAMHHVLRDDNTGALQVMRSIEKSPWKKYYGPGKYYEIANEPAWAGTVKSSEFQKILAGMKEEVVRQRAIVEAADAEHDFRAEIEQLMAN
jgi:TolB-like protein/Tfp pilus assembly protein PilF